MRGGVRSSGFSTTPHRLPNKRDKMRIFKRIDNALKLMVANDSKLYRIEKQLELISRAMGIDILNATNGCGPETFNETGKIRESIVCMVRQISKSRNKIEGEKIW